ncbi:MAG: pentapeptide repeat-containing protein, partial [Planctomycetales bacterium]|nr:pentapeptide repeat-containing protein [Planctomycetales bacterium]
NLSGAIFGAAVLDGADLTGADLSSAQFVTASLQGAQLRGANLASALFMQTSLAGVDAAGADFSTTDITGCDFSHANLQGATLAGAKDIYWLLNFSDADLSDADLHGMVLKRAEFQRATLVRANLQGADLESADFSDADLTDANLTEVKISHADFRTARGVSDAVRSDLVERSRIWQHEAAIGMREFLESPLFALVLLGLIPLGAYAWRRANLRGAAQESPAPSDKFQFSLSTILLAMALVGVVLGVGAVSLYGIYSLWMTSALWLMLWPAIFVPKERWFSLAFVVVSVVLPAVNAILLMTTGPIGIFGFGFLATIFFGLLGFTAGVGEGVTLMLGGESELPKRATLGFTMAMLGLAMANLWVLAEAAASV